MEESTFEMFAARTHAGQVVPVVKKISLPLTPESAYIRLRKQNRISFLFESVERSGAHGRYSFTGSNPVIVLRSRDGRTEVVQGTDTRTHEGKYLDLLASYLDSHARPDEPGLPPFSGGWVGFIGYDMINQIEQISFHTPHNGFMGDAFLGLFTTVAAFDHLSGEIFLIANVLPEPGADPSIQYVRAMRSLEEMEEELASADPELAPFRVTGLPAPDESDRESFMSAVETAKHHITEGDIFQVVLSRRILRQFVGDTFHLYRALKQINPSPYMYHLDLGNGSVIGTSPEVMVSKQGTRVETFPIAGTRKRGANRPDAVIAEELLSDPKERAEHIMLVDLGRNDIGKAAIPGSVRVDAMMDIVSYSHVMHLESRVSGEVRVDLSPVDLFKAAFPAGTVTGAPKIRAMQIIDQLEPSRRGPYAGAVGYFDFSGNLDTCIAIRTIFASRSELMIQAGAGIVFDSVPELEYMETVNKSGAMLEALKLAERMSA